MTDTEIKDIIRRCISTTATERYDTERSEKIVFIRQLLLALIIVTFVMILAFHIFHSLFKH